MSEFEKVLAAYQSFPKNFKSIIISTVSQDGVPNASYTPFIIDDSKNIYIYVSDLATHTQNIHSVPKVSVLFIEDESQTPQIFARKRLNFDCEATLIARNSNLWQKIEMGFVERFGEIMQLLRDLPDFHIFQLKPIGGRFIVGFGSAYEVDTEDLNNLKHITGK